MISGADFAESTWFPPVESGKCCVADGFFGAERDFCRQTDITGVN
jgi:hypothetical protein